MPGIRLSFETVDAIGANTREIELDELVIAGWTGRNRAAMAAHIEELAKLGVPRPAATPMFYRVGVSLLTTDASLQVMGAASSGEVEPVLVASNEGLWVGVGSDHTDRAAETQGITLAKQLCPKPLAPRLWRFDEVADHWDDLILRSYAVVDGTRRLYQQGTASVMLPPGDLMTRYCGPGRSLPSGTAMFCGTMAVEDDIAPADSFEVVLEDPVLQRAITHAYAIHVLPVMG